MLRPLAFALFAAIGNALFVYGQRAAASGGNPFLFTLAALVVCTVLFVIAALVYQTAGDGADLARNAVWICVSGLGFFMTFVGFFLLYTTYGASTYVLYAVLAILTTTLGVGVLMFREPFNGYQTAAMVLAVASIALFTYGRAKGTG